MFHNIMWSASIIDTRTPASTSVYFAYYVLTSLSVGIAQVAALTNTHCYMRCLKTPVPSLKTCIRLMPLLPSLLL